jgi:LmbE family N-acetylglucosaminyl deacetylase
VKSLLVIVAHPDDELIGMAGVIASARREGRRVVVTVVTNGDAWRPREHGLRRDAETLAGLALLGVPRDDVVFLGYPDGALDRLPRLRGRPTYALDGGFRFLQKARHTRATRRGLARDLSMLIDLVNPAEVYTHVPFDGHGDHAAVARFVLGLVPDGTVVRGTLMHPPGAGNCLELSAGRWPNSGGAQRFRPDADVEAPPSPPCVEHPPGTSWGPLGAPDVLLEVPTDMQEREEAANLKWRALTCHASQLELGPVSAGYLRAFVKRHEFFWTLAG